MKSSWNINKLQGQKDALKAQYSELCEKIKILTDEKSNGESALALQLKSMNDQIDSLEHEKSKLTHINDSLNCQIEAKDASHKLEIRAIQDQSIETLSK